MTNPLHVSIRGDWAKQRFPDRAMFAMVYRGADVMIRDKNGATKSEPTYDVFAKFHDSETQVLNLSGVTLETARFNARCVTGSFGEK